MKANEFTKLSEELNLINLGISWKLGEHFDIICRVVFQASKSVNSGCKEGKKQEFDNF